MKFSASLVACSFASLALGQSSPSVPEPAETPVFTGPSPDIPEPATSPVFTGPAHSSLPDIPEPATSPVFTGPAHSSLPDIPEPATSPVFTGPAHSSLPDIPEPATSPVFTGPAHSSLPDIPEPATSPVFTGPKQSTASYLSANCTSSGVRVTSTASHVVPSTIVPNNFTAKPSAVQSNSTSLIQNSGATKAIGSFAIVVAGISLLI